MNDNCQALNSDNNSHCDYFPHYLDWQYGDRAMERPVACQSCRRKSCFKSSRNPSGNMNKMLIKFG